MICLFVLVGDTLVLLIDGAESEEEDEFVVEEEEDDELDKEAESLQLLVLSESESESEPESESSSPLSAGGGDCGLTDFDDNNNLGTEFEGSRASEGSIDPGNV